MWVWVNGKIAYWEQKMFDKGNEELMKPAGRWIKEAGTDLWVWFVEVLPDIAGYGVMACGAFIILGSMISDKGMMKPLACLAGGLILSVCILMTN